MDAAFDCMLDILNGEDSAESSEDNIENINYDIDLAAMLNEVRQLAPPAIAIVPRPELVEVIEFDTENNVLNPTIREAFKTECVFEETEIFTRPISTTNTMEGFLSNVSFHERDIIEELIPDQDMVLYRCNYGKVKYPGYTEPVKQRKTNRGRKKKEKKKKLRKKQGDGGDFNSQTTFVVRSTLTPEPINEIIPVGTKVYKFKVFRTGKLQLPGVHPLLIDDVVACTKKIANILNFHLHPGEINPTRITNVININPVMKNYKFAVKLPPGHIIDMEVLKGILQKSRMNQFAEVPNRDDTFEPDHPNIFMLKYTRQETKLSIKFATPIFKKPKKRTRINIFMRGKINILGAFHAAVTRQICEYLHWIFETEYDTLVVPEGSAQRIPTLPRWNENIEQLTEEDSTILVQKYINWLPPLPVMTTSDFSEVMEFVDTTHKKIIDDAMLYFNEYFSGADILQM